MSREFDTIVRLSFSLLAGLITNEAIFLGDTPISSEGALLCDFLPQLHGALYTGYSNEDPLFSVVIFQLERSKVIPTTWTSGDLLLRRCEQIESLDWVRVIFTLYRPPN